MSHNTIEADEFKNWARNNGAKVTEQDSDEHDRVVKAAWSREHHITWVPDGFDIIAEHRQMLADDAELKPGKFHAKDARQAPDEPKTDYVVNLISVHPNGEVEF